MYGLPKTVTVCGTEYAIRSDFREILEVMEILNDARLSDQERGFLTLLFFYTDFREMPPQDYADAQKQCYWFLNGGKQDVQIAGKPPKIMDWEQDFSYIISPVNRVLGYEARMTDYLHWWTFLSAYMEIGECTFAQIVHIRDQQCRGKPLNKADREWYRKNKALVDLKTKYTSAEEEILKLWGGG